MEVLIENLSANEFYRYAIEFRENQQTPNDRHNTWCDLMIVYCNKLLAERTERLGRERAVELDIEERKLYGLL